MRLFLNGDERDIADVSSVADLVQVLGLDARKVAVERNLEIVPRSTYGETALSDGDRIEIVTFIGGG
ncbi:sulfur carrier protein ThiS [Caulobacter henricii]|uniref:Thiamine biosynthesis protein ThiS n=1 Tax=Caulobacter henricii TaxID=69395 RepID=A0A0P0NZD7_9CAUL|nr:sulfur carrier protein ThiS [Caulobacter henricii]ALL13505.1 thiamine biosynthesis protein ThiS [Caulobacter henricii]